MGIPKRLKLVDPSKVERFTNSFKHKKNCQFSKKNNCIKMSESHQKTNQVS